MSRRVLFLSVAGALALGGCATVPKPIAGDYAPVSLDAARTGTATANRVRWGGEIIETQPRADQTCFFVLAQPLDSQARPQRGADSNGRFVACKQGFYDPEVFRKGRDLTVTGTLAGTVQHKIGQYEYTYAKVDADNVYLWPKRPVYVDRPYDRWGGPWGPCDPFWSPWGCGWGGYGPWYPPRVIVVPRPAPPPPPPSKP
ncbi:MAG TPA: Slp family lipoprotein [Rhodanobacteraceae bacterium]|nr:Slp family lipoprotein [Rhodanobacteraceae bacterium]